MSESPVKGRVAPEVLGEVAAVEVCAATVELGAATVELGVDAGVVAVGEPPLCVVPATVVVFAGGGFSTPGEAY